MMLPMTGTGTPIPAPTSPPISAPQPDRLDPP
jgi:hypothetical protein